MLDTLLESRPTNARSIGGTVASVTVHTALIAGALYATAQASARHLDPANVIRVVYFPTPSSPVSSPASHAATTKPVGRPSLTFVAPRVSVDIKLPAIDITGVMANRDFRSGPVTGDHPAVSARGGGLSGESPLRADQVEKQVAVVPGSPPPRYPEALRSAGVEGQVIAQFVVDASGRAEEGSLRFLRSDSQLFESAVRAALGRMRFVPAEVGGLKVRQLVQMPFVFTLAR
ncbi:MAG: energy transducer TonB [Gemmatimonadales bacterium]